MDFLVEYLAKGFMVMLMISLPCVLVAAGIGLVVGILQAVTQVQEQTIAAAPKILFVFLTIVILGAWYIKTLKDYIIEGTNLAFEVLPRTENFTLPADYYNHTKPFTDEVYYEMVRQGKIKDVMNSPKTIPWKDLDKPKYSPSNRGAMPRPDFLERKTIERR